MTQPITLKTYNEMEYHPTSEKVVEILCNRTQITEPLVFRIMVAYYFASIAAHMRCTVDTDDMKEIPVNLYALNLAPSGFGKGKTTRIIEDEVIHLFATEFQERTFPLLAEENIPILANKRAVRKGTDPDNEIQRLEREFETSGPLPFSFSDATTPAVKQMRHKLLIANGGAMNLEIDEIGLNLSSAAEALGVYLELYDKGITKNKLKLSTSDNKRVEEIKGATAANLLMFGSPVRLFDGAATEQQLYQFLDTGYARRCFFGYATSISKNLDLSPEEIFNLSVSSQNSQFLDQLSQHLHNLADPLNVNTKLAIAKETSLLLIAYKTACEKLAESLPPHEEMRKAELSHRYFKVLKLAGAYAFIDGGGKVTNEHIYNAIKLAEDSGVAFDRMLNRDRAWVKLAKYIADIGKDITHADLAEDLPFYKGGFAAKQEMLTYAIGWGYKNNIIIKKSFSEGIEFLRGEKLRETDLNRMIVAHSDDITVNYQDAYAPFEKLHQLTQLQGMHWVNHHLKGGYRNEDNAIPGFNLVVVDVDGTTTIDLAKELLKGYKFLLYTTKSHTADEHCFRIILPINFELKLDAKDYKEFMSNIYQWLPFEVDTATNQRARKWLSHSGSYEYCDGELLDALPFIPKTSKNEERKAKLKDQQSLDNLERWMINNIGDGNRNNLLHRYAMVLVDNGLSLNDVTDKVLALNSKIPDSLDETEVMMTIMTTVKNKLNRP